MTLVELQKVLGDRVTETLRTDQTAEQRQVELEKSKMIMELARQMINNGDLIIRYEKLEAQKASLKKSIISEFVGTV